MLEQIQQRKRFVNEKPCSLIPPTIKPNRFRSPTEIVRCFATPLFTDHNLNL
jgi:hypothetical protein